MADPTAIPTSALASTGPSLSPSPTIIAGSSIPPHCSKKLHFSSGDIEAFHSSTPADLAIRLATAGRSPVSRIVRMSSFFNVSTIMGTSGSSMSSRSKIP